MDISVLIKKIDYILLTVQDNFNITVVAINQSYEGRLKSSYIGFLL